MNDVTGSENQVRLSGIITVSDNRILLSIQTIITHYFGKFLKTLFVNGVSVGNAPLSVNARI